MPSDAVFPFLLESNYRYETIEPRYYGAREYAGFPVRVCMPVPAGMCRPDDRMELRDDGGQAVPCLARPLLLWADGSVRVWDVLFPASLRRTEQFTYTLQKGDGTGSLPVRALMIPPEVTVSVTLGDGAVLRCRVALPPLPKAMEPACWENETDFELTRMGEYPAFRGTIVRKAWSWNPGAEFAIRLINVSPFEMLEVKEARLEFNLPGSGAPRYTVWHALNTAAGPRIAEGTTPFTVRADAGGIHVSDIAQLGLAETDFPPYERGPYLGMVENWTGMTDGEAAWVLAVPEAAERGPKGWRVDGRHVTLELHPGWGEPLLWRQGMALFQRWCLSQLPKESTGEELMDEGLRWLRPPIVTVPTETYQAAGWRVTFPYQPERYPRTEFTIRELWNFSWVRGTFNWGDDGFEKGRRNHEYDFIANAAKEFARTGHTELWKLCRSAAEHMMHTDFVAVSADPWKEGGVPAHCRDHTAGAAYPSHMWVEGLLLYHQLSGDPYALKVAMRVGDFFLKYIDERFQVVQGTGREMGWTLVALGALYDVTREERYLNGIRKIVDFYLERGVEHFFPTDATFCIGVAVIGFDRVRPFYRNEEIGRFMLGVLDWIMAHRCDDLGIFDYWHDSERKAFPYIQAHLPEALNLGYRLSGDLKYLKAAWRLFQIHQGGAPLTVQHKYGPPESGYAGGYHITWTMGCLQSFAEQGWLDTAQYSEPWSADCQSARVG
ncbi:MAG: beta-L-arabinofuranosidase domain-containing protein [Armatimonadota bacterium]